MVAHNSTEEKLLTMYERIGMGNCRTCSICHANIENLSIPFTAWCVGNNFNNENKKILFVGKNARGGYDIPKSVKFLNVFDHGRWFWKPENWRETWGVAQPSYWNYTREITGKIFGDNSFEHIAFTNLVKCNNSPNKDTTSDLVKRNCICDLKVFSKEAKIIRPTHIIFYTSWYYDGYIQHAFETFKTLNEARKKIGAKYVPWGNAEATIDALKIRVLVTGHPQYLKKDEFTNAICSWVKTPQS